jgi:hypothetical protein
MASHSRRRLFSYSEPQILQNIHALTNAYILVGFDDEAQASVCTDEERKSSSAAR